MARNLWSDRQLGVKLAALVAAGGVSLGLFAVVTVQALGSTGERTDDVLASAEATGDALEAGMMHDAVRADVLQALLSGGAGSQYSGAVSDLTDHGDRFRELFAEMLDDDLSPDVVDAVEDLTPSVESYLASAQQIVGLAGTSPGAARAAYPEFSAAF